MKLIRGLFYITAGVVAGVLLKRFLSGDETPAEPVTVAPQSKATPSAPTEDTDTLIPVIEVAEVDEEEVLEVVDTAPTAVQDDLTQINGIGATYAKRLHEAGIHSFVALAQQKADHLREITKIQEWQAADPTDWIA
ncbi:MAG: helix-hairpin-helix domain-containing protein, partial [Anaerolineales bacterium]|nr:helix-hairpin-helix domain-containing protein [Anaerolineales bacterium]